MKSLRLRTIVSPTPVVIVAAFDKNGKADACTLAFYMPSSHHPPCVTIGINATAKRKTLKSILSSGAFSVGYPSADQVSVADFLGIGSGEDGNKLATVNWTFTTAEKVHAPIINEIPLSLECRVINTVTPGGHTLITGEIMNIVASPGVLDEKGRIIMEKFHPIIYDEEQRRYLVCGEKIADAFSVGLPLLDKFKK